jgi:hypothetical protein
MLPGKKTVTPRSNCSISVPFRHAAQYKRRYVRVKYSAYPDPVVSTQWLADHLDEVRNYYCCLLLAAAAAAGGVYTLSQLLQQR